MGVGVRRRVGSCDKCVGCGEWDVWCGGGMYGGEVYRWVVRLEGDG